MRVRSALGRATSRLLLVAYWTQCSAALAFVPLALPVPIAIASTPLRADAEASSLRPATAARKGKPLGDSPRWGALAGTVRVAPDQHLLGSDRDARDDDRDSRRHRDHHHAYGDDDEDCEEEAGGDDGDDDDHDGGGDPRRSGSRDGRGRGEGSHGSCRETLQEGDAPRVRVAKKVLWPPNHRLVDVGLSVDPGEACCGRAAIRLQVFSDEPDNGTGDGDTDVDAQMVPPDLFLRQERSGSGDGRVYLVAATATYEGVSSTRCATVVVPTRAGAAAISTVCAARRVRPRPSAAPPLALPGST